MSDSLKFKLEILDSKKPDSLLEIKLPDIYALDVETFGLRKGDPIRTVSFGTDQIIFAVSLDPRVLPQSLLKEWLINLEKFLTKKLVCHNVLFDILWLQDAGIDADFYFDTMLAAYCLGYPRVGLKRLVGSVLKEEPYSIDLTKSADVPIKNLLVYCAKDSYYCYVLYRRFLRELKSQGLDKFFFGYFIPFARTLLRVERNGFCIDKDTYEKTRRIISLEILRLKNKILMDPFVADIPNFKITSPLSLRRLFFDKMKLQPITKTPHDSPSLSASVLKKLSEKYDIAKDILEFRKFQKLKTTYVSLIDDYLVGSKIYPRFLLHRTRTGRLASAEPNFQNIPNNDLFKKIFVAPKDYYFLEFDYSQAELRTLAVLSQDPKLIRAFHQGLDLHSYTASRIFKVPRSEVTKDLRKLAKGINFGLIYGMSTGGLANFANISFKDANTFRDKYFQEFEGVSKWRQKQVNRVRENGYLITPLGRKLYINRHSPESLKYAVNYPVQSVSSDLTLYGILRIDHLLRRKKLKSQILGTIHDSIQMLLYEPELKYLSTFKKRLETFPFPWINIPWKVDIKIGKSWGGLKLLKI